MPDLTFPEYFKIISCYPRVTTGATLYPAASQYVDARYAQMVWISIHAAQADATPLAFTIEQATSFTGTGTKVITVALPIWSNLDTSVAGSQDLLVRRTAAVGYTTDVGVKNKHIVFQLDPATLDTANGFRWIILKCGAGAATSYVAAEFILDTRYKQATPPASQV
jgi:hypothetical protein